MPIPRMVRSRVIGNQRTCLPASREPKGPAGMPVCAYVPCIPACMTLQVYKGRRRCTGQITAMKFIVKHGKSEKDIRNLRQEIEILRQLRHENIIQMLDAFETKTDFCVVTGGSCAAAAGACSVVGRQSRDKANAVVTLASPDPSMSAYKQTFDFASNASLGGRVYSQPAVSAGCQARVTGSAYHTFASVMGNQTPSHHCPARRPLCFCVCCHIVFARPGRRANIHTMPLPPHLRAW